MYNKGNECKLLQLLLLLLIFEFSYCIPFSFCFCSSFFTNNKTRVLFYINIYN